MARPSRGARRRPWLHYDSQVLWLAGAVIVILFLTYFFVIPAVSWESHIKEFWLSIITNLIPTLIVVIVTYLIYSKAQQDRASEDREDLIDDIADLVCSRLKPDVQSLSEAIEQLKESQLTPTEFYNELSQIVQQGQSGNTPLSRNKFNREGWGPDIPKERAS